MLNPFADGDAGRIDNSGSARLVIVRRFGNAQKEGPTEQTAPDTANRNRRTRRPRASTCDGATRRSPSPATSEWEKELRRLLGGEPRLRSRRPSRSRRFDRSSSTSRTFAVSPPVVAARRLRGRFSTAGRIQDCGAERSVAVQLPRSMVSTTGYQRASRLHEGVPND